MVHTVTMQPLRMAAIMTVAIRAESQEILVRQPLILTAIMAVTSRVQSHEMLAQLTETQQITVGDISPAFLTSPKYLENEGKQFVAFREYRGGRLRVFRLLGSLYNQRDAPFRFYGSLSKFLKTLGFKQYKNDVCLYVHKRRKVRGGTHVDDLIARANRHQNEWVWTVQAGRLGIR